MKYTVACMTCLVFCLLCTVVGAESLIRFPLQHTKNENAQASYFEAVGVDIEVLYEESPTTPTLHFLFYIENESDSEKVMVDPARKYRLLLFQGKDIVNEDLRKYDRVDYPQNGRVLRRTDAGVQKDQAYQPERSHNEPTTVKAGWREGKLRTQDSQRGDQADLIELNPGELYVVDLEISQIEVESKMSCLQPGTYHFVASLALTGRDESGIVHFHFSSAPPIRKIDLSGE